MTWGNAYNCGKCASCAPTGQTPAWLAAQLSEQARLSEIYREGGDAAFNTEARRLAQKLL